MLGYMMIRREELRFREFDRYRAYYCGLCRAIGKRAGAPARLALSFEMTFLAMLLTSLYEEEPTRSDVRCGLHPLHKQQAFSSCAIDYCADCSALVSYYDLRDGWEDERRPLRLAASAALSRASREAGKRLPRQRQAVETYLGELHALEKRGDPDLDGAAKLTGAMLAELYDMRRDVYSADLRTLGDSVGRFIAFLDSFEDLERDARQGNYNPLLAISDRLDFTATCEEMLSGMMAPGADAFERLPILDDAEIMRNILYSGMWLRFERAAEARKAKKNG